MRVTKSICAFTRIFVCFKILLIMNKIKLDMIYLFLSSEISYLHFFFGRKEETLV